MQFHALQSQNEQMRPKIIIINRIKNYEKIKHFGSCNQVAAVRPLFRSERGR